MTCYGDPMTLLGDHDVQYWCHDYSCYDADTAAVHGVQQRAVADTWSHRHVRTWWCHWAGTGEQ